MKSIVSPAVLSGSFSRLLALQGYSLCNLTSYSSARRAKFHTPGTSTQAINGSLENITFLPNASVLPSWLAPFVCVC